MKKNKQVAGRKRVATDWLTVGRDVSLADRDGDRRCEGDGSAAKHLHKYYKAITRHPRLPRPNDPTPLIGKYACVCITIIWKLFVM